jgi:FkbM family methyltransferase
MARSEAEFFEPLNKTIFCKEIYERDYLYQEIFEENCYWHARFMLPSAPVIFDVGANIGLFSLYMHQKRPLSTIYAFEPAADIFSLLEKNTKELHDIHLYDKGLSRASLMLDYTFYKNCSVISGFNADFSHNVAILMAGMKEQIDDDVKRQTYVESLLSNYTTEPKETISISQVIDDNNIKQIDLLKVDTEGSEYAILEGISVNDWQKIKNISLEAHSDDILGKVTTLLKQQNYHCEVVDDPRLKTAGVAHVFAFK